MPVLAVIAFAIFVFCSVGALLTFLLGRRSRSERRLLEVIRRPEAQSGGFKFKEGTIGRLLSSVKGLRAHLGLAQDEVLLRRFSGAGIKAANGADMYFGARILCPVAGLIGGSCIPGRSFFWALALGAVGYLVPDLWLRRQTKLRRERIRKGIPDAIDLLVICVEAGLGLDQALLRVGQELNLSYPELNEELLHINREQRAGKPRLEAWQALADRTELDEFRSFVNMLTQTDRFGTPIVRALSRFSDELRMKRRQKAEEKAAKTKIKILFPLVLFIFPCLFIVLLAPAVLSVGKNLQSIHQ